MNKSNIIPVTVTGSTDSKATTCNERKIHYKTTATKQEIKSALKLIELLFLKGEIPQHVYRNICNEYYGKGIDIAADACYTINTPRQDAV